MQHINSTAFRPEVTTHVRYQAFLMAARAMSKNGGWLEVLFVALMSIGLSWAFSLSHVPRRELTSPLLKHTKATALGKARDARHFAFPAAALFGFGGGEKSSRGARSGSGVSGKARKAIESNAVFKSRTEQYARGAITASDLLRSLERDVANKLSGCDVEDVIAAAIETIPDKRRRSLLSTASGGRAIGPGGSSVRGSSRGGADLTIQGAQRQYAMSQGGQRISSGKSTIYNGVEIGKEETPLKMKVITRANAASVAAEVSNMELIRAKNGPGATSRHFVEFLEYVENYNGRGDAVLVMRAESIDLRKLADANGGDLGQAKLKKYASEMANIMRCVHEAGLVWTDLKLDNMLLCQGGEVKAIDLESAVPAKSAPKSFSPEAMPPDFAIASVGGFAGVTVDKSFDVWSLGMAILHLYLGRGYFHGSSDAQTIAALGQPGFSVDLSEVKDGRIRGLLQRLLDPDEKRRLRYFESPMSRLAML